MRALLLAAVLCLPASLLGERMPGRLKMTHITSAQGLPGNTIRDIVQDDDGFLWMAGTNGLARYDGYRFVPFNNFGSQRQNALPQHIGKLYLDRSHHTLWLSTSTYTHACLDLSSGRFVDFTGRHDTERPYRKALAVADGVWMSSNTLGLRHVIQQGNRFHIVDYTTKNHRLLSDRVLTIEEDTQHNIWAATDRGLARIDSHGRARILLPHVNFLGCYANGNRVLAFSKINQTAYVFDLGGRLLCRTTLPQNIGHIGAIKGCVHWQGQWLLCAGEASLLLQPKRLGKGFAWIWSRPQSLQIPKGAVQSTVDGLQFVANQSGNLWIFPQKGPVRKLDLIPGLKANKERNTIFAVTQGHDGKYYIGSYGGGLFVYDYATGHIDHYTAADRDAIIPSNYIIDVATDRTGSIWVSMENAGVVCLTPSDNSAAFDLIDAQRQGDWTNFVRYLYLSPQGQLMVMAKNNQLYSYDMTQHAFAYKGAVTATILNSLTDSQHHTWLATRGNGVWRDGQQMTLYVRGKRVEINDFYSLAQDHRGRIWIGCWGQGLFLVKAIRGNRLDVDNIISNQYNESRIHDITITTAGLMVVATFNGIYAANINHRHIQQKDFHWYSVLNSRFPTDEITCVRATTPTTIWAGTVGGLIRCDFSKGLDRMTYHVLSERNGLSNNNIKSLITDRYGYLWAGTDNGLSRIDPRDNYIRRYQLTNDVLGNTFAENCALRLPDGRIIFGTGNGMVTINPAHEQLHRRLAAPHVLITDLLINGISIYEGLDSVVLARPLQSTARLTLSHTQNSLTIHFSSFAYSNMQAQLYQYYMEGVDHQWRPVTATPHTEYSNLAPGTYVFHVRAVTQDAVGPERVLTIHISEPWYNTWWAWAFYLALIAAIILYISRSARERLRLHQQMKMEKQLTEMRTSFFTHVTHEFRTPLAVLSYAVENIAKPEKPSRKDIQTAQRGIHRLMRLVNQFLEFRRLNTGNIRLQVESGDIIAFLRDIYQDLWGMATQKHLNYNFVTFAKSFDVAFDPQAVETIVYNLLSNAVKYTPEKREVTISVRQDTTARQLVITVEDDGPGLSTDQQERVFHPYMSGYISHNGMGIGLYTAYNMAKVHHGTLVYQRASTEGGSRFILSIPDNDESYTLEEYQKEPQCHDNDEDHSQSLQIIQDMAPNALNHQLVAIVEDAPDMQEQIKTEVGKYFRTVTYSNGEDAVRDIALQHPDLLLCDIMLPGINGYDTISAIRKQKGMGDLPVIMLTALDDEEHQIKGYQAGADDYMVKPCNYRLLIARAMQLIKWRQQRNKQQPSKEHKTTASPTVTLSPVDEVILTSPADKRFREQVEVLVGQHLTDQNFSIDQLAAMMSMGRTKFYGKMKELYGMSPNKYLMKRRMDKAAELLLEGKYTVSEVSYRVGIPDSSYFNKCFKAAFGTVPSKYRG